MGVMTYSEPTQSEKVWLGPEFPSVRIFVLGESWYGDFTDDLETDDGYVSAYLAGKVTDALYTRIANATGLGKARFWRSIMFTNFAQRVGPTRDHRPSEEHYRSATQRLSRLLVTHSPRGVWILGLEQARYSEPVVRSHGIPVEVTVHPSSYGVKHATLRAGWEALLSKVAVESVEQ